MNGDAVILETVALDHSQEEKVVARFKADRDDQYKEFLGKCAGFEAEIAKERATNKFTYAELEEEDAELKKLQVWLEKTASSTFTAHPELTRPGRAWRRARNFSTLTPARFSKRMTKTAKGTTEGTMWPFRSRDRHALCVQFPPISGRLALFLYSWTFLPR